MCVKNFQEHNPLLKFTYMLYLTGKVFNISLSVQGALAR